MLVKILKKLDFIIRDLNHQRIDFTREIILNLFKIILDQKFSEDMSSNANANAVLVLRLDDKIGDSVTSTGFLKTIKDQFPQKKLIIVAGQNASLVFSNLLFIDEIIISKKGLIGTLKTFFKLRGYHFNFLINTTHILSPRILFLCSCVFMF